LADLSEFFGEPVQLHLGAVGAVVGGAASNERLVELGLQVGQVGLESTLVVVDVADAD